MTTNIQQLTEKRKKWVEANRENGFEDGIKRLLTDLYPDNAHFIYELLQNAEDVGASKVAFLLNEGSIEFEHNGDRLFSMKDVESITSIGNSTKISDPISIGKFGVGFKAVFAYTSTPEIHSGDFHFRISELVIPDTINQSQSSIGTYTRFIFPFNNPKKPKENACKEIEKSLLQLSEGTLLFLRNIRKIEYVLPNSSRGCLERIDRSQDRIEIVVQHPNIKTIVKHDFLRFEKTVEVHDEEKKQKSCRIAAAFNLVEKTSSKEKDTHLRGDKKDLDNWEIKSLKHGQVSIYFPAEKETSNLRFHIHAPFASTIGRDSVRDCAANNELRDCLAELIVESLLNIRDLGLLTVGFLSVLPNDEDNLPGFYKPIMSKIVEAFRSEDLTPMKRGGYAAAKGIFRGQAQLSSLINDDDLAAILGKYEYSPPMWVANPTQKNQREDNFLSMLEIGEWNTEDLVNALPTFYSQTDAWFVEKKDDWYQQLYAWLGDYISGQSYKAMIQKDKLERLAIVKKSDGSFGSGKKCFFSDLEEEHDKIMPRVSRKVYSSGKNNQQMEKAYKFLVDIGVREVGAAEQAEAILKNRYSSPYDDERSFKLSVTDLKLFIAMIQKDPSQGKLFVDYYIFKQSNGMWGKPGWIYLDMPFLNTGLEFYFGKLKNNAQIKSLDDGYKNCGVDYNKLVEFALKLGAIHNLPINEENCNSNPDFKDLLFTPGRHRRQFWNEDYTVIGLSDMLRTPNKELSRLVWQKMNSLDEKYLYARMKLSDGAGFRSAPSQLVHTLKSNPWVPQKNGKFVLPREASADRLPRGFTFTTGHKWLEAVDFGVSLKKINKEQVRQILELGFDSVDEAEKSVALIRILKGNGKTIEELLSLETREPDFPSKVVQNPERRKAKLLAQLANAPEKKFENRSRSVRPSRGFVDPVLWLRKQYTNEKNEMICQICRKVMPFKKRNGEYYFEAVEVFSSEFLKKEHEALFLALCPLCAARYKEYVKNDKKAMKVLNQSINNTDESTVPLTIGNINTSVTFVDSHWLDIKTILHELGS